MTIFYFTGTGNSLFAARKIADASNATLVSIPQAITERQIYNDDVIGFVYPQYANGLPKMVRRFIVKNTFEADYFFAVNLWAFIHIGALGEIAGLIPLNYGTYLKTPNNFLFLMNSPKNPGVSRCYEGFCKSSLIRGRSVNPARLLLKIWTGPSISSLSSPPLPPRDLRSFAFSRSISANIAAKSIFSENVNSSRCSFSLISIRSAAISAR